MLFIVLAFHLLALAIALVAFWRAYKLVRNGGYAAVAPTTRAHGLSNCGR